ncbi:hypothetical protein LUZ62_076529 [Rhynchospora pubera]|uniref:Rapid ALkalinization Factor n=1 Tax=Rhynchospora pubera TaxID=906938 RepID=A0AAV8DDW3_9POAL|nr:hypothetical protein LUZ62_076529 [Rhynchospora pubera]
MMNSKLSSSRHIYFLLILGAFLLYSQVATAAMVQSLSSTSSSCNGSDMACRIESQLSDEVELPVDLEIHRRILAGSLGYPSTLNKDRPACNPNCANPGSSYTGNHCTYKNHCGQ